jgi:hypothetical protein
MHLLQSKPTHKAKSQLHCSICSASSIYPPPAGRKRHWHKSYAIAMLAQNLGSCFACHASQATLRSLLPASFLAVPQLPPLAPWREVVADGQPSFSSPSLRFGVRSSRLPCQWLK